MTILSPNASPAELAELISEHTGALAETCKKLADNPMGSSEGRNHAGQTGQALAECNAAINAAANSYQQTHTVTSTASFGMGGSSSSSRQGQ